MKKGTAPEFIDQLNADPAWVAAQAAREAAHLQLKAQYRHAERPLLADLRVVGYDIETVWDLVNTTADYPDAVPTLFLGPRLRPGALEGDRVHPAQAEAAQAAE